MIIMLKDMTGDIDTATDSLPPLTHPTPAYGGPDDTTPSAATGLTLLHTIYSTVQI